MPTTEVAMSLLLICVSAARVADGGLGLFLRCHSLLSAARRRMRHLHEMKPGMKTSRSDRSATGSMQTVPPSKDTIVSPTGIESGFDRLSGGPAVFGELASATHINWMRG